MSHAIDRIDFFSGKWFHYFLSSLICFCNESISFCCASTLASSPDTRATRDWNPACKSWTAFVMRGSDALVVDSNRVSFLEEMTVNGCIRLGKVSDKRICLRYFEDHCLRYHYTSPASKRKGNQPKKSF